MQRINWPTLPFFSCPTQMSAHLWHFLFLFPRHIRTLVLTVNICKINLHDWWLPFVLFLWVLKSLKKEASSQLRCKIPILKGPLIKSITKTKANVQGETCLTISWLCQKSPDFCYSKLSILLPIYYFVCRQEKMPVIRYILFTEFSE